MEIEILGAESLGVRGLACFIKTAYRRILIDPGVALGYHRSGLLPHPIQVAAGEDVRRRIVNRMEIATDVVISHFHGDHLPLQRANPYQLSVDKIKDSLRRCRLWFKEEQNEAPHIRERKNALLQVNGRKLEPCTGRSFGIFRFSQPMPHGFDETHMGSVMMTRIEDAGEVFVHASDIQLLSDEPIQQILDWSPTILLLSGPPIYRNLKENARNLARKRALVLAQNIGTCIIDHHLLRCKEGIQWLDELRCETYGRIVCAADYMNRKRRFLESMRTQLYKQYPVPDNWHSLYAEKLVFTSEFRDETQILT